MKQFLVVNAFGEEPYTGNPAAVFPDARSIPESELQSLARQLNLVESVFAYPAPAEGVDFHLRYFTPALEIPVAGHPTVAAWLAFLHLRLVDVGVRRTWVQSNGAGVQRIQIDCSKERHRILMEQPPAKWRAVVADHNWLARVFGIRESDILDSLPAQGIDCGLGHLIVPVRSLEALLRAERRIDELGRLCAEIGVREAQLFCFEARDAGCDLHTRNICPRPGIEDPACGNGNGALGYYLWHYECFSSAKQIIRAEQGHVIGKPSVIDIVLPSDPSSEQLVMIGGTGVIMIEGAVLC